MSYPDLPNNRLIVGGIDITAKYGLILADGYTLNPPAPKTYTVDIPNGDGCIDLTDALTGDVAYENRQQSFTFYLIDTPNFENSKTEISNYLHGKDFDYTMTMDPGYVYHGRFSVSSYTHGAYSSGILGTLQIDIDAEPFKKKSTQTYSLNALGGKMYTFQCGRKSVRPIIECSSVVKVGQNGSALVTVPAGTYCLNTVIFKEGNNELYLNSGSLQEKTWSDIKSQKTWSEYASSNTYWFELQKDSGEDGSVLQAWKDISAKRFSEITTKKWSDLNYRTETADDRDVYISYEWKDL